MTGSKELWEALLERAQRRPPGLAAWRAEAEARLRGRGLPTRKDEDFRRLPQSVLEALPPSTTRVPGGKLAVDPEGCVAFSGDETDTRESSSLRRGLSVRRLEDVLVRDPALLDSWERPEVGDDAFFLANSAGFSTGWLVEVESGAVIEEPLLLALEPGEEPVSLPRIWIRLGAGSRLACVEVHRAGRRDSLSSAVTEVTLEAGAELRYTCLVEGAGEDRHFGRCVVRVGERAVLEAGWGGGGGRLTRQVVDVRLRGDGARAALSGLLLCGADTTVDHQARVWHSARDTRSEQVVRAVVAGGGHAIMNGSVEVEPGSQRADARQELRGLLLEPNALIDTKPELLIGNDDVACSHGATVGALDEEQLFYLRSRGLSAGVAKRILIHSFAEAGLRDLQLPWIRERMLAQIRGLFPEKGESVTDEVIE